MKTNDIRLGNYLIDGRVTEVCPDGVFVELKNTFKFPRLVFIKEDDIEPITLNEDVLIKIGFEAMHSTRYMYEKPIINKNNVNDVIYITFHLINKTLRINFSKDLQIINLCGIECLHQLQNVYYLLTNEEFKLE